MKHFYPVMAFLKIVASFYFLFFVFVLGAVVPKMRQ